jgi:hypothetical protein
MKPACNHAAPCARHGLRYAVLNVFLMRPDARPCVAMHVFGGEKRRGGRDEDASGYIIEINN